MLNHHNSAITWQVQLKNALKNSDDLIHYFELNTQINTSYPILIPLTFAQKIKFAGKDSSLWKQFIPSNEENLHEGNLDPIGDIKHAKGHGIIHRYKSRILYTPTPFCPIACRYCFRKNELSSQHSIFKQNLTALKNYLLNHKEVNEVILTGGDPLMISNSKLIEIFEVLSLANIKFVRIHTRTPIILPARIDDEFINLLERFSKKFTKVIFILHTNHSDEIDHEVFEALNKLRKIPIKKCTQSVLLKNINNNEQELIKLFYKALDCDFTPYYLHHPDKAKGAMHFWIPLEEGRKIYAKLRSELPGWALPHYIIDHPSGAGKQLAFNPESYSFSGKLLNSNGQLLTY